jgi:hypothetical protein
MVTGRSRFMFARCQAAQLLRVALGAMRFESRHGQDDNWPVASLELGAKIRRAVAREQ